MNKAQLANRMRHPAAIVGLVLAMVISMFTVAALTPVQTANAGPSYEDCQAALGYPDRDDADKAFLNACVKALRPYVAPSPSESATPTPSASATATPTPSATPTPTATVPPPPPLPAATYFTNGRFLYDPAGYRVVVRGVEQNFSNQGWLPNSVIGEIGRETGANSTRMLPHYTQGAGPNTLAQIEDQIKLIINNKMMVDVAIDGGRDPNVYLRADIKALLLKYEKYIVIHAKGESYEATEAAWLAAANTVVNNMRAAGYKAPLYIMANTGGRNLPTLLHQGAAVVANDPLHNVILGWQAYWGSNNGYQNQFACNATNTPPCTLEMAMDAAAAAPFPISVGLIYRSDPQDNSSQTVPFQDMMKWAQENQLMTDWWDGRQGIDNLSKDAVFGPGHWATPGMNGPCAAPCNPSLQLGLLVAQTDPNSIRNTSVRSPWLQLQSV